MKPPLNSYGSTHTPRCRGDQAAAAAAGARAATKHLVFDVLWRARDFDATRHASTSVFVVLLRLPCALDAWAMSSAPREMPAAAAEELRRHALPALDSSFSKGLGLGIAVNTSTVAPSAAGSGAGARHPPAAAATHEGGYLAPSAPRVHGAQLPSLATSDRLVVNDVLAQYNSRSGDSDMSRSHDTRADESHSTLAPPITSCLPAGVHASDGQDESMQRQGDLSYLVSAYQAADEPASRARPSAVPSGGATLLEDLAAPASADAVRGEEPVEATPRASAAPFASHLPASAERAPPPASAPVSDEQRTTVSVLRGQRTASAMHEDRVEQMAAAALATAPPADLWKQPSPLSRASAPPPTTAVPRSEPRDASALRGYERQPSAEWEPPSARLLRSNTASTGKRAPSWDVNDLLGQSLLGEPAPKLWDSSSQPRTSKQQPLEVHVSTSPLLDTSVDAFKLLSRVPSRGQPRRWSARVDEYAALLEAAERSDWEPRDRTSRYSTLGDIADVLAMLPMDDGTAPPPLAQDEPLFPPRAAPRVDMRPTAATSPGLPQGVAPFSDARPELSMSLEAGSPLHLPFMGSPASASLHNGAFSAPAPAIPEAVASPVEAASPDASRVSIPMAGEAPLQENEACVLGKDEAQLADEGEARGLVDDLLDVPTASVHDEREVPSVAVRDGCEAPSTPAHDEREAPSTPAHGERVAPSTPAHDEREAPSAPAHDKHEAEAHPAAEDVENLVDDLLNDQVVALPGAGVPRSHTLRRITMDREGDSGAPTVQLPTLPSWTPIMFDGLLPDVEEPRRATELPTRTARPHISRDDIRARVERRKSMRPDVPRRAAAEPAANAERAAEAPEPDAMPAQLARAQADVARAKADVARAEAELARTMQQPRRAAAQPPVSATAAVQRHMDSPLTEVQANLHGCLSPAAADTMASPAMSQELERQATWFGGDHSASSLHDDVGSTPSTAFHSPMSQASKLPELPDAPHEAKHAPAPRQPSGPTAFSNLMERELERICAESDQKYRVQNRGVFEGVARAQDEAPAHALHRPWARMQRGADVPPATSARAGAVPSGAECGQHTTTGRLFFYIDAFTPYAQPAATGTPFYCVLDNGIHMVKTISTPLTPDAHGACLVGQEFELVESDNLEITLTLMLEEDVAVDSIQAEMGALPTAEARTGVGRFFQRHLGTRTTRDGTAAKKLLGRTAARSQHGRLGTTSIALGDVEQRCYARCMLIDLPVAGAAAGAAADTRTARGRFSTAPGVLGSLRVRLFYLPPLPGVLDSALPGSLDECVQGMDAVVWHEASLSYAGTLTQLGGDCLTWRRRPMRIMGLSLVCYNEVTQRPTTRIDLGQALAVEPTGRATDDDDEVCRVPRAFRISFRDGERIYLYADTDTEMFEWLRVLQSIVAHKLAPPPSWAAVAMARLRAYRGTAAASGRASAATATVTAAAPSGRPSTARASASDAPRAAAPSRTARAKAAQAPPRSSRPSHGDAAERTAYPPSDQPMDAGAPTSAASRSPPASTLPQMPPPHSSLQTQQSPALDYQESLASAAPASPRTGSSSRPLRNMASKLFSRIPREAKSLARHF